MTYVLGATGHITTKAAAHHRHKLAQGSGPHKACLTDGRSQLGASKSAEDVIVLVSRDMIRGLLGCSSLENDIYADTH